MPLVGSWLLQHATSLYLQETTCTKSAVPIRATKRITNRAQTTTTTTTSAGMKATTTITATPVAMMSRAGVPCPAMPTLAQTARAKKRRIFT